VNVGLVLRVAPTGRKTWSLSYRNSEGRQQRYTIGTWPNIKVARARQLATERLGEVAGGHDVQAERQQHRQKKAVPTLKAFVDDTYGAWVKAHHKSSAATLRRLRHTLPWQDTPLDQITLIQAERWQTARLNDGLAPETVKRDVAVVRSLLSKALLWGYIEINPLASLRAPKGPDNTVVRYLDKGEEERLLAALDTAPAYLRTIVIVALNTGLRQGEILKLNWSSIDLTARRLTVTAKTAKSSKVRHIPLNGKALTALQDWRDQGPGTGVVFQVSNVKKSWASLLRQAGIEGFRFHDLRHHFASKLVMAGIDLNTVRELLGHSDIRMTLRYAHLAPAHIAAAVEVL
jgi:integrase